jgi:hypothetical protein
VTSHFDQIGTHRKSFTSTLKTAFHSMGFSGGTRRHYNVQMLDFDKLILYIRSHSSMSAPANTVISFYSDYDYDTVVQSITATPVRGRIETLLKGAYGESIAFKVEAPVTDMDTDAVEISGYEFMATPGEEI